MEERILLFGRARRGFQAAAADLWRRSQGLEAAIAGSKGGLTHSEALQKAHLQINEIPVFRKPIAYVARQYGVIRPTR